MSDTIAPLRAIRVWLIPVAIVVTLLLSGCSGGNPVFQPTITQQHASDRVEKLLRAIADGVSPRPHLDIYKPGSNVGGCLVNPSDTSDTRVQVTRAYFLTGIPQSAYASIGEQVLRLWRKAGYKISDTNGVGGSQPSINAVTQDDFLLELAWTGRGELSIGATSPCLWPNGTPPPGH